MSAFFNACVLLLKSATPTLWYGGPEGSIKLTIDRDASKYLTTHANTSQHKYKLRNRNKNISQRKQIFDNTIKKKLLQRIWQKIAMHARRSQRKQKFFKKLKSLVCNTS